MSKPNSREAGDRPFFERIRQALAKHAIPASTALLLLPPLLGLLYIKLFGVNVVNYDQWEFIPLIEKLYAGTLGLGDLFAQHNEHRIFFPRIIMLALACLTKYNVLAEMYASWAFALGTYLLVFGLFIRKMGKTYTSILAFLPAALLLFSFRQCENILWGWQIQVYMCVFGFIASLYLLDRAERIGLSFAGGILFAVFASFSFVNGLLVWPVNAVLIALGKGGQKAQRLALWTIAGIATWAVYFYGWASPGIGSPASSVLGHIGEAALYFVVNVGSTLAFEKGNALGMGIILLAGLAIVACLIMKGSAVQDNAPWICLILFALATSAACVIGRSGLGIEQALTSRYTTFTVLGVIGAYAIIFNLWSRKKDGPAGKFFTLLLGAALGLAILGILVGYSGGVYNGINVHADSVRAADTVLHYRSLDDGSLAKIYPLADHVRYGAGILEKYRLNVFSG
jgi:hypothetical protein